MTSKDRYRVYESPSTHVLTSENRPHLYAPYFQILQVTLLKNRENWLSRLVQRVVNAHIVAPSNGQNLQSLGSLQVESIKRSHVQSILNAFKIPTQSILKTMKEADDQSSKYLSLPFPKPSSLLLLSIIITLLLTFQNGRQATSKISRTCWLKIGLGWAGNLSRDGREDCQIFQNQTRKYLRSQAPGSLQQRGRAQLDTWGMRFLL